MMICFVYIAVMIFIFILLYILTESRGGGVEIIIEDREGGDD